ncbi:putative pentatricopeptide repeat-containing protein At5g37570 [Corylus avellana]|uniref:putative pentatricopeptide repeat-containing protein At5g37570 n=1 Tax=Corylus avellana TaxID=13451 RepID=UPI00286CC25D|nr:putative pentatricopeptide repeat-containing protein At5g37570 [Corylus avellana]
MLAFKKHPYNKADIAASLLKTCSSLSQLKQIHAHIVRFNLHGNASLASTLVSLYASLSSPRYTRLVFSSFSHPNLSLFNHAIRAFSKTSSLRVESINLYAQMVRFGIRPDNFTYPFLLNSCAALTDLCLGIEVHGRVVKAGFGACSPVSNALIDMYGKCGALERARRVFDEMGVRDDVVSYNALLGAHARGGDDMVNAQDLFDKMPVKNMISWNAMIVGYVNSGDLGSARAIFNRMPERNAVSWTTMLVGYTKNGLIDLAKALFDEMPERSLVCWTAMISGYAQNGRPSEALALFQIMEKASVKPDAFTMTAAISASAQLGRPDIANWIASYVDQESIEQNEPVLTALVDMHAKCGNLERACCIFEEIPRRDIFSYSALITGLASHGHGVEALEIFQRMMAENVEPDHITFVGVLTACSHAGLVEDGMRYWESMIKDYKIEPDANLFACMVDMLGRAGKLDEAHKLVKSMPMGPQPGALGALLAACRTYGNVEIAEIVSEQLFKLEPENTGNYMLLISIYASRERWDEAKLVREAMEERRVIKLPGCSWVESDCNKK